MPVSIDWPTRVINVPQDFLTPLGGANYQLDTESFRYAVLGLLDDAVGMAYPDVFNRNAPVTLGGIQYAQTIEIINGYTVTFEEKVTPYKVFLAGSNNNILDVTNLGTVSVAPNNSAGLITMREIQRIAFSDRVWVDQTYGEAGTLYPVGTPGRPVNNMADAVTIASYYNFDTLQFIGDAELTNENVANFKLLGQNAARSMLTIGSGANVYGCEIQECRVTGTLDGNSILRFCYAFDLSYVSGFMYESELAGTITLAPGTTAHILSCYSDTNDVTIDMGGSGAALNMLKFGGDVHIANKTGSDLCEVYMTSGEVTLEASVTSGAGIELAGNGHLHNLSGVTPTENFLVDGERLRISEAILRNKTVTDPTTGIMTVYDTDGVTPLYTAQLYEDAAGSQTYRGSGAERRERLQ